MIIVDLERLPARLKQKMANALEHLERVGRQANRIVPSSYMNVKELGVSRIWKWAKPNLKPAHQDNFHKYLGEAVCKTLLYCNCRNCPAKRYYSNSYVCRRKLGEWSMKHQKEII